MNKIMETLQGMKIEFGIENIWRQTKMKQNSKGKIQEFKDKKQKREYKVLKTRQRDWIIQLSKM